MFAGFAWSRSSRAAVSAIIALTVCTPGFAAPRTPAGTAIANTAQVSDDGAGGPAAVSNTVVLTVAELLDVAIAADRPAIDVATGARAVPTGFRVSNEGNAPETFSLSASAADGTTIAGIAADDDDDGVYDPAADPMLSTPAVELQPGAGRRIFVLMRDLPAGGEPVAVTATATAVTGHGEAGTVFAGAGRDGVDAVVGRTGARASARTVLNGGAAQIRLEKSQAVRAPNGSDRIVPGATVTWQLDAIFPRAAGGAVVSDPIPQGTRFVPGSITLDGQAMTDGADADAGSFDGSVVRVALGPTAAGTRTIRFQTIIQ